MPCMRLTGPRFGHLQAPQGLPHAALQVHVTYLNGTAVVISWATGAAAIGNATTPTTPLAGWQTVNGPFSSIVQIGTKPGVYTNNATGYTTNCEHAAAQRQCSLLMWPTMNKARSLVSALSAAHAYLIWQAHACPVLSCSP